MDNENQTISEPDKDDGWKLNSVGEIVTMICENTSCLNCPVTLHDADFRTKEEHENQVPCQSQLWNWMKKAFEHEGYLERYDPRLEKLSCWNKNNIGG